MIFFFWFEYRPVSDEDIKIFQEPLQLDEVNQVKSDPDKLFRYEYFSHFFTLPRSTDGVDLVKDLSEHSLLILGWSDLEVQRTMKFNSLGVDQLEMATEWWVMERLGDSRESIRFSIRPSDELLQQIWESDLDLGESFRQIDLRRPPVRAELIIPY